jgi:LCP family protein required for cell wall assembly
VSDDQWSWDLPRRAQSTDDTPGNDPAEQVRPRRAAHGDESPEGDFTRTVLLTIAGAIIPGLGLIAAHRRVLGGIILGVFAAMVVSIGIWAVLDPKSLIAAAVDPALLRRIAIGLIVLGLAWVAVIVISHLSLSRGRLRPAQRAGAGLLVAVLSFAIAAPAAVASRYSYDQAGLVNTVFHRQNESHSATRPSAQPTSKSDPWKDTPRVNILLLGGDAGPDRTGTRTDTVMVASIDTRTGDTTLISLPRNTAKMPFPANSPLHKYYPNGFTNGDGNNAEYFLNAMYDNVPNTVPKNILGKTDDLGADVMKISVGDALGLKIDYYVLIDLAGFKKLIDALGGITVNINTYVAIGGNTDLHIPPKSWLKPGPHQHLNGDKALWFARGRYGADDFQRMDRQRCVVNAIIDQANPANVLTRYEAIAKAGKEIVHTDIPQEALPAFVDLSMRVKGGNVRSLVFKHGVNGFLSPDPNFELMRSQVKKALSETKKEPSKPSSKAGSKPGKGDKPSSTSSSGPATQSESTKDACAWQPSVAATAQPPG